MGFAKLFNDELTLDNISRFSLCLLLISISRFLWSSSVFTLNFCAFLAAISSYLNDQLSKQKGATDAVLLYSLQAPISEHVQIYGYQSFWHRCIFAVHASKETEAVSLTESLVGFGNLLICICGLKFQDGSDFG